MKKYLFRLGALLILPILLIGCGKTNDKNCKGKLNIIVSISPLKEFVQKIGGDKVNVQVLVPKNVEPHDFELKTRDVEKVISKDLFIYNGANMEDWVEQLKETVSDTHVKLINSSTNSKIIKENGKLDPHLWLSPKEAENQCKTILDAIVKKDPQNKQYYLDNYNTYKAQLDNLFNEYSSKFADVTHKDFVTGHEAFGYLCRDFRLKQKSITDVYAEGEATSKTYQDLVKFCNDNGIKVIFDESSESSKEAVTLANEIGGKVQKIYSLENPVKGKTYIEVMTVNLDRIYNALK